MVVDDSGSASCTDGDSNRMGTQTVNFLFLTIAYGFHQQPARPTLVVQSYQ